VAVLVHPLELGVERLLGRVDVGDEGAGQERTDFVDVGAEFVALRRQEAIGDLGQLVDMLEKPFVVLVAHLRQRLGHG